MKGIHELRALGRAHCQTDGSEHYKQKDTKIEAFDLINTVEAAEGFCIGSIIKYAARFGQTQNLKDLVKVSDYAQLLVGVKLDEQEEVRPKALKEARF